MKLKRGHRSPVPAFLLTFWLIAILLPCFAHWLWAAEVDLKPGDTIGPHNWQRVQGMVGENLLNRIKQGYTLKIKESKNFKPPKEYLEATDKYSGQVRIGRSGELLNYVAGLPFPNFDLNDSQAGLKLAWNFYWRWLGDDYKNGGLTKEGKVIRDAIERDGSERRGAVVAHTIFTRSRVIIDPKPVIPGYEHIDWMQLRADEYPRDTSGTTTLEIRYADPAWEDDFYIYVPSIRRVRRAPPVQRCATIAPSEFNFDDINTFNGKVTNFNYRLLGEKKMLSNFSQEQVPFHRKSGDYLPVDEGWEVQEAYVLEITPKDSSYCYPKKIVHIHKILFEALGDMIWDKKGNYWKETFAFLTPVKLPDGRGVWSPGTVVMVNVQNGRSTVLTVARRFNQGYQPTLFTLATLQTVMRGGAIR
jgi:hypothetical protein